MRYTQNINLPIVEDNDLYSKEINNLAFEKIDEEIQGLADIVETLDSPENSIADVKKDINDINEQLDTKANEDEVVKKGYGTLNDFDEETRLIIQGMESGQINAVLGKENVKTENISQNDITPSRTST